jgi:hypothetical protein
MKTHSDARRRIEEKVEIPAANLFDGRMGMKAFKELHSCAGGLRANAG